jgi:hypothetical protein
MGQFELAGGAIVHCIFYSAAALASGLVGYAFDPWKNI